MRCVLPIGVAFLVVSWGPWVGAGHTQGRRDLKSVNVCQLVPGEQVAALVGGRLAEARPFAASDASLARCTYLVDVPAGGPPVRRGYAVWLYPASDFEQLRKFTDGKITDVPGIGDGAHAFQDPGDGRFKIRVLKRGDVTIEASADTAEAARKIAAAAASQLAKGK